MAFTSPDLVSGIVRVTRPDTPDSLLPFIEAAGNLVTRLCSNSGYDDETMELIERWLAAHFYVIFRPRARQETISPGPGVRYEDVKVDLGLNNTKYGQQAMLFDTAGNLAIWNAQIIKGKFPGKPNVRWLGTVCSGYGY